MALSGSTPATDAHARNCLQRFKAVSHVIVIAVIADSDGSCQRQPKIDQVSAYGSTRADQYSVAVDSSGCQPSVTKAKPSQASILRRRGDGRSSPHSTSRPARENRRGGDGQDGEDGVHPTLRVPQPHRHRRQQPPVKPPVGETAQRCRNPIPEADCPTRRSPGPVLSRSQRPPWLNNTEPDTRHKNRPTTRSPNSCIGAAPHLLFAPTPGPSRFVVQWWRSGPRCRT